MRKGYKTSHSVLLHLVDEPRLGDNRNKVKGTVYL
jgi:hypothetical protein